MADQTQALNEVPKKTHAENILNRIVDLVPGARSHIAGDFKKLHDEVLKLIPTGGISQAVTKELDEAKAKISQLEGDIDQGIMDSDKKIDELTAKADDLAKQLETALGNVEKLTNDFNQKNVALQTATEQVNSLTAQLNKAKGVPPQQ